MNKRRLTKNTLFIDAKIASIIFFNSGITEINRNTLNIRKSRKTKKLELFGIGINEIATIIVSNTFHPSFKKFFLSFSPIKRIRISITKNTVMV